MIYHGRMQLTFRSRADSIICTAAETYSFFISEMRVAGVFIRLPLGMPEMTECLFQPVSIRFHADISRVTLLSASSYCIKCLFAIIQNVYIEYETKTQAFMVGCRQFS